MLRNKGLLFVLSIAIFTTLGISGGLLNVAWTYMKDTFQVDVSAIGILLLFATSGSLIATMSSGTLAGKFGLGRVTALGICIVTAGLFAIALNQAWVLLLLIFFMLYTGRGLLDASMNNFVAEHFGTSAMNWLHASWGVGLTIAPGIMTVILVTFSLSWQAGYIFAGSIALVLAVIVIASMRQWDTQPVQDSDQDEMQSQTPAGILETLRQPGIMAWIGLFFVYGGAEIGTGQLLNTLFVDGRMMSQESASAWLSSYWGSFTLARILMGWVALRFTDRQLLRGSLLLSFMGGILLIWSGPEFLSWLAVVLLGTGFAGIFPTLVSQTPARVGRRYAAQAVGLQIGVAGMGGSILPGLIGFVSGHLGLEWIAYGLCVNVILLIGWYVSLQSRWPLDSGSKAKRAP
ncbi:MFS transporter [Phototrophicus methaneseepsis]|uniref:MFS transporter n=1 Tax=Phototrophicus methaneseepsis TaxID=2710758 RepID=A0A7S8E5F8_9CHLR|nr:MFS transporter [Phototrophicus methaneseepsis]QPC80648.1 MFS transporter [Phototrophicus methaneseepsis]